VHGRSRPPTQHRTRGAAGTEFVATLNGTLCAVARTIACLLDHHQQPDGTVYVPKALRPWLGDREVLSAQ
jgi:seryl-tRNA synthetase